MDDLDKIIKKLETGGPKRRRKKYPSERQVKKWRKGKDPEGIGYPTFGFYGDE
jgi:hypothetical protein